MKRLFINLLNKLGYRLVKAPIVIERLKVESNFLLKHKWIVKYNFETIIDIGANKGQFAARFRVLFPDAMIYSFEPIPEVFDELCKRFEKDNNFKAFNLGLGREPGTIDFYQNEFSDSSSALPMKRLHKDNFPKTSKEKLIKIKVGSLDEVMQSLMIGNSVLIKIDVQGFEELVILGGKETLKKALIVIVEVSFYELYESQVYFNTIYNHLFNLGFSYRGNYEQLISPLDGSILQADAIFFKENG